MPTPYQRFYEAIESPHTRPAYEKYLRDFFEYSKTDADGIVKLKQQDIDDLVFNYLVHTKTRTDKTNVPNPNSYNVIFSPIQLFLEQNDIMLNWKKIKRMYPRRKAPTNSTATKSVIEQSDDFSFDTVAAAQTTSTTTKKKSGSSCEDCTPPTLGVNKDGKRMVDNGFSFEGFPVDVRLFYTPYPLIGVQIGYEFSTTLKIYENQGPDKIKHVGLAFGLGEGEIFGDSKAMIELDRTLHGEDFAISVYDPENSLENVRAETEIGPCLEDENESSERCLIVTIYHTFRESLDFNMVSTYVWDFHRNGWQNYYNHGIHIMGESLNPPEEYEGSYKGHRHHLTETGKDTAVDENGNTWSLIKDIWTMDYIPTKKIDGGVTMHGYNRENVRFEMYKQGQILLAENTMQNQVLRGEKIINDDFYDEDNYFTIFMNMTERSEDPILQANIIKEQQRAEERFEKEYWKQK